LLVTFTVDISESQRFMSPSSIGNSKTAESTYYKMEVQWFLFVSGVCVYRQRNFRWCPVHLVQQSVTKQFYVTCFLLGSSPASEFYTPTFQNTLSVPSA